jgi:hypothetical protein
VSSVLTRRKAAQPLRFIGFAALGAPLILIAARSYRPISLLYDMTAMAVGAACLSISLWFRGERRDAKQVGLLGIVSVLAILYAWGVS